LSLEELGRMPREVWIMTAVAAITGFGTRTVMSFMVIYAVEVVGLTKTQWGLIGTAVSLVSTSLTMPGGMLADRIGRKPCIVMSRVLSSLSTLGFTFSRNFWHMGAVRVLGGVGSGFGGAAWGPVGGPVWQALVVDVTPPEDRGRMMGLMGTIQGLVSTPASWVGGYMYDNVSPELPFYTSFALNTIGTVLFIALLKEPGKPRRKS
jgi:DHA1 family multidrug resistance protein-like MFS transporter